MGWPEPPKWLAIIASVVLAPLWVLFLLGRLIHEIVATIGREVRERL